MLKKKELKMKKKIKKLGYANLAKLLLVPRIVRRVCIKQK
jgi:hypothetical protein